MELAEVCERLGHWAEHKLALRYLYPLLVAMSYVPHSSDSLSSTKAIHESCIFKEFHLSNTRYTESAANYPLTI
jgi:hypothetical protein